MTYILLILSTFNCYLGINIYHKNTNNHTITYTLSILGLTCLIGMMLIFLMTCHYKRQRPITRIRTWSQPHIDIATQARIQEMTRLKDDTDDQIQDQSI